MTEKFKFPKSVSFNKKNPTDQAILKHVARRNFSGYVKKLILADMSQKGIVADSQPSKAESASDKMARMKEKLKSKSSDRSKDKSDSSSDTYAD